MGRILWHCALVEFQGTPTIPTPHREGGWHYRSMRKVSDFCNSEHTQSKKDKRQAQLFFPTSPFLASFLLLCCSLEKQANGFGLYSEHRGLASGKVTQGQWPRRTPWELKGLSSPGASYSWPRQFFLIKCINYFSSLIFIQFEGKRAAGKLWR